MSQGEKMFYISRDLAVLRRERIGGRAFIFRKNYSIFPIKKALPNANSKISRKKKWRKSLKQWFPNVVLVKFSRGDVCQFWTSSSIHQTYVGPSDPSWIHSLSVVNMSMHIGEILCLRFYVLKPHRTRLRPGDTLTLIWAKVNQRMRIRNTRP